MLVQQQLPEHQQKHAQHSTPEGPPEDRRAPRIGTGAQSGSLKGEDNENRTRYQEKRADIV
jgi:hypothetical protein